MRAFKQGDQDMKDEARIVRVETVIEHISFMLDRIDKRFDSLEKKVDDRCNKIETDFKEFQRLVFMKFEKIDDRFFDLHKESKNHFRWLMAFGVAILGSPLVIKLINYFHLIKF